MTDEPRPQSRRERVGGTTKQLCTSCGERFARHRVTSDWLCCKCYVGRGYPPAEWHPECMAAAALGRTRY